MFGRKKRSADATVVGPGAVIRGTIQSDRDVHVDGTVDGSIQSDAVVALGPSGVVHGDVTGDSVTVGGRIEGTVRARDRLHMLAGGQIKGDALYGTLQVDSGGVIEGRTTTLAGGTDAPALPASTWGSAGESDAASASSSPSARGGVLDLASADGAGRLAAMLGGASPLTPSRGAAPAPAAVSAPKPASALTSSFGSAAPASGGHAGSTSPSTSASASTSGAAHSSGASSAASRPGALGSPARPVGRPGAPGPSSTVPRPGGTLRPPPPAPPPKPASLADDDLVEDDDDKT